MIFIQTYYTHKVDVVNCTGVLNSLVVHNDVTTYFQIFIKCSHNVVSYNGVMLNISSACSQDKDASCQYIYICL
jgi:hypothetical protein